MASTTAVWTDDTRHEDQIHDVQLDYYGKRLATCSSDRLIKLFEVVDARGLQHLADLKGHEGPVWQVSWAHPKFGSILCSCSYDRKVIVWKETSKNNWSKIYEYTGSELSVNAVAWAPYEFGLSFACGSTDGTVSVISYRDNKWVLEQRWQAHSVGVNSLSWGPAVPSGTLLSRAPTAGSAVPLVRRLVTGGGDNLVRVWRCDVGAPSSEGPWREEEGGRLEGHSDWVRDVAWAPAAAAGAAGGATIASCSQDGSVVVWSQDQTHQWTKKALAKFADVVWRVSWSVTGGLLAVSCGDNKVTLWKESLDGEWKQVSQVEEGTQ